MILGCLPRVLHSEDRQLIFAKYKTRMKMFTACLPQGSSLRIVSETRKMLNKAENEGEGKNTKAYFIGT